jgi:hypothetical protein
MKVQIIEVDTGEGVQKFAWYAGTSDKAAALAHYKENYGDSPDETFPISGWPVCGPLVQQASPEAAEGVQS